jgi:hypothetical protein
MQETTRNANKRFKNCHLTPIIPFKISLCSANSSHIRHRIYHSRSCHLVISHTCVVATQQLINWSRAHPNNAICVRASICFRQFSATKTHCSCIITQKQVTLAVQLSLSRFQVSKKSDLRMKGLFLFLVVAQSWLGAQGTTLIWVI